MESRSLLLILILVLASICNIDASFYREYKDKKKDIDKKKYRYKGWNYYNKYYGNSRRLPLPPPPPPKRPSPKYPPPTYTPVPYRPEPPASSLAAQFLMPQNDARARVGLRPLVWDSQLEAFAKNWANDRRMYGNCYLKHSDGPYGENIFWGGGKSWTPEDAAKAWIDERQYYSYGSNSCKPGEQCGHYTQVVWRDTQRVGCATVTCSSGDVFITCNYDPPGNYIGERPY